MGYQIATVRLSDGSEFRQVLISGGIVAGIKGRDDIPFEESEIVDIVVTHDISDYKQQA
jgi:hypothetical protein